MVLNGDPDGEEAFIAKHLAALSEDFPGAFGLKDDCAELRPLPGHALVLKTDPIVAGVHFFADDPPEDLAWKALAVNVSDLAAKGARPVGYLMALMFPAKPEAAWMVRFTNGLKAAQDAFGCVLLGGDTDLRPPSDRDGPLSITITVIGEVRAGRMVERKGAKPGDVVYVTGELGLAALGLQLRLDPKFGETWPLAAADRRAALNRYLRPEPKLGLRAALQTYARSAMDISDGVLKDLGRMCRLSGVGADVRLAALPLAAGLAPAMEVDRATVVTLATAGDDYEILSAVPPDMAAAFENMARQGGLKVTAVGIITPKANVRLLDDAGLEITPARSGYDHFARN